MKWIPLKQWLAEKAEELKITTGCANDWYYKGKLIPPNVRKVNSRVVLIGVEEKRK